MLKLGCTPFAFISYKAFLKNKKRSGTSLSASFSACFLKKYLESLSGDDLYSFYIRDIHSVYNLYVQHAPDTFSKSKPKRMTRFEILLQHMSVRTLYITTSGL